MEFDIEKGRLSFRLTAPYRDVYKRQEYLWGWCEKDAQRDHYIHKIPILELWQADADALLNMASENTIENIEFSVGTCDKY